MFIINKIELENFKSFCEKTTIRFSDWFNVITGCNGAGKSNLISAIKFVLMPDELSRDTEKFITGGKIYTRVSAVVTLTLDTGAIKIIRLTRTLYEHTFKYFIDEKEVGLLEYKSVTALFQATGARLIDTSDFLYMNDFSESEIAKASRNNQYIVVSLKEIDSADETIYVTQDENGYSKVEVKEIDYYTKYYGEWRFLMEISVKTALGMIKQKPESEIQDLIDLSYAEIDKIVKDFCIKFEDVLSCEINDSTRIDERESEIFLLIKHGYNIQEISRQLMVTQGAIRTHIKRVLAKILLHLYPNLKEEVLQIKI